MSEEKKSSGYKWSEIFILLVLAIGCLYWHFKDKANDQYVMENWIPVQAEVVDAYSHQYNTYRIFEYQVEGEIVRADTQSSKHIGDVLLIYYNPTHINQIFIPPTGVINIFLYISIILFLLDLYAIFIKWLHDWN